MRTRGFECALCHAWWASRAQCLVHLQETHADALEAVRRSLEKDPP
jgi:hypothetical protein